MHEEGYERLLAKRPRLDNAVSIGDLFAVVAAATFPEFEKVLMKLGAKLSAREVHALYLGAITSTSFQLGPQRLLGHIFDGEPTLGASVEDANTNLQILFGYWNTLLSERKAGRLGLAPARLPAKAKTQDLVDYARRRHEELLWYVRGIDAGGDDPMEFGERGQKLFKGIAEGGAYLHAYVELLERTPSASPADLGKSRAMLLELVETAQRLIGDLMDVSDAVRREAMQTFSAQAGRKTDDGARVARPVKVGRNQACPCGSGKKWKKCCGGVAPPVH
jgi:hypothetical protein